MPRIRQYEDATDRDQVVELWRNVFGYETAHNEPNLAISKKIATKDGLFFVAVENTTILIVEHNEEGSIGFVVNRSFEKSLNELIEFNYSKPLLPMVCCVSNSKGWLISVPFFKI